MRAKHTRIGPPNAAGRSELPKSGALRIKTDPGAFQRLRGRLPALGLFQGRCKSFSCWGDGYHLVNKAKLPNLWPIGAKQESRQGHPALHTCKLWLSAGECGWLFPDVGFGHPLLSTPMPTPGTAVLSEARGLVTTHHI